MSTFIMLSNGVRLLGWYFYNSFAFHLTMAQSSLWAPAIAFVLWLVVAMKYRALFAPIFRPGARAAGGRPLRIAPVAADKKRRRMGVMEGLTDERDRTGRVPRSKSGRCRVRRLRRRRGPF